MSKPTDLQALFAEWKPKPELEIWARISAHTGKYIGCVFKKVVVNRRKAEYADTCVGNIATSDWDEYLKFLKPHIEKRGQPQQG